MSEKKNQKGYKLLQLLSEIGVVTIGILIAYQLNNWKEVRATHSAEKKMLKEIRSNLRLDLIDLNDNIGGHISSVEGIDSIRLIAESEVYSSRVPLIIRNVFRDYVFNPQTSAFETLKAKGVDLIRNDSIRIRIIRLYDFNYKTIEKIEESYAPNQFSRHYDHIVLTYFDGFDLDDASEIRPVNSGTKWLLKPDIKNRLALTKAEHLFCTTLYKNCILEVESIINVIDEELENKF